MREDAENTPVDLKQGNGALWTIAGMAIAMTAKDLLRGGLGGIFGPPVPLDGPGAPVTREVMRLSIENSELRAKVDSVAQQAEIDCLKGKVAQLQSLTQIVVPNANLNPGVGPVQVVPVPPVAPPADIPTITAVVQAVLAAQAKTTTTPAASNG